MTFFFTFLVVGIVFILVFASQPWLIKQQVPWHYLLMAGHLVFLLTGLFIGLFLAPLLDLRLTMEHTATANIAITILLVCVFALRRMAVNYTELWPSIQRSLNTLVASFSILFIFTATLNLTALIRDQDLFAVTIPPLRPEILVSPIPQPPPPMVQVVPQPRPPVVQVVPQPTVVPTRLIQPRTRLRPTAILRPTATRVLVPTSTPTGTVTATPTIRRLLLPTRLPN